VYDTTEELAVPELDLPTSEFKISPPAGMEEIDVSSQRAVSLYETIREDILSGRLQPNADLAERLGTSTNPIREALQMLRGEGFVMFSPNRGARVRPIDHDFVRNIYEISALIEPALTHWFVGMATDADIAELERIQRVIEENNFVDAVLHSGLDVQFHTVVYQRHYNRHAAEIWWKHRQVLRSVTQRLPYTLARRSQVLREHRELIEFVKAGEADKAADCIRRHVEGSGRHILEQMRAYSAEKAG
jgi:DNA-binding GntR family transcriptional regulator